MSFAILAELPLGTYRGHVGDGQVDRVPSPARLASALLCAAASGPRAFVDGGTLHPCAEDLAALYWLEQHPPDGMRVPPVQINRADGIAYRVELLQKSTPAKTAKPMTSVAVGGQVAWTWRAAPPPSVVSSLESLCPEVSHLGMAETPVRMRVGEAEPTHTLAADADWWDRGPDDLDVAVPVDGRADALLAAYRGHATIPVRTTDERVKVNESHRRPPYVATSLADARYRAPQQPPPATPWAHALLASIDPVPEQWRVRWAGAVHRALIALIGYGAPAVLTGSYAPGVSRPANRCALQIVGEDASRRLGTADRKATLALLIPASIDAGDLTVIVRAWERLSEVRGPGGRRKVLQDHTDRRGDSFWPEAPTGHRRRWRPVPAAVPETRGQGRDWSLADAVALSAGLVFRDELVGPGRGQAWYRALAEAARARGLRVESASRVREGDLSCFVHRTQERLVVQPYQAVVDLGGLAGERTVLALGQSRHLGCGLLVPVDLPVTGQAGAAS